MKQFKIVIILSFVFILLLNTVHADVTSNLTVHYSFQNMDGNKIIGDVNSINATNMGCFINVTGPNGNAIYCNASSSNSYINSSYDISTLWQGTATIGLQINSTSPGYNVRLYGITYSGSYGPAIIINDSGVSGRVSLLWEAPGGKLLYIYFTNAGIHNGQFHRLLFVKKGYTCSDIIIYLDGVSQPLTCNTSTLTSDDTSYFANIPAIMSQISSGSNTVTNGSISEFAIWDRALTSDDALEWNATTNLVITNITCTSCNPPTGDTIPPYETDDTTPTFTLHTNVPSYCRIEIKILAIPQ